MEDIQEFRITWKREVFFKNKSRIVKAKCLIRKSIGIGKENFGVDLNEGFSFLAQRGPCRGLDQLKNVHRSNQLLAEYLQKVKRKFLD